MEVEGQGYRWFNRPPNAEPGDPDNVLNENHVVILEMDGSITVHASIENRATAPTRSAATARSLPRRGLAWAPRARRLAGIVTADQRPLA